MGVSGCGKTSVGQALAARLGVPFFDADAFHPAANTAKMSQGLPLNDDDRAPWLAAMAAEMPGWDATGGAVLACSALKERYREVLAAGCPGRVRFVYLQGEFQTIYDRMQARADHFFPPTLLESQFAALEEPTDALVVSIALPVERIVAEIVRHAGACC